MAGDGVTETTRDDESALWQSTTRWPTDSMEPMAVPKSFRKTSSD